MTAEPQVLWGADFSEVTVGWKTRGQRCGTMTDDLGCTLTYKQNFERQNWEGRTLCKKEDYAGVTSGKD